MAPCGDGVAVTLQALSDNKTSVDHHKAKCRRPQGPEPPRLRRGTVDRPLASLLPLCLHRDLFLSAPQDSPFAVNPRRVIRKKELSRVGSESDLIGWNGYTRSQALPPSAEGASLEGVRSGTLGAFKQKLNLSLPELPWRRALILK